MKPVRPYPAILTRALAAAYLAFITLFAASRAAWASGAATHETPAGEGAPGLVDVYREAAAASPELRAAAASVRASEAGGQAARAGLMPRVRAIVHAVQNGGEIHRELTEARCSRGALRTSAKHAGLPHGAAPMQCIARPQAADWACIAIQGWRSWASGRPSGPMAPTRRVAHEEQSDQGSAPSRVAEEHCWLAGPCAVPDP